MLPSFGSMSMPADVPHVRPAGNSPQFCVTFGVGLGSPSPVMKLATFAGLACASRLVPASEVARKKAAPIAQADPRTRGRVAFSTDMTSPLVRTVSRAEKACAPQGARGTTQGGGWGLRTEEPVHLDDQRTRAGRTGE